MTDAALRISSLTRRILARGRTATPRRATGAGRATGPSPTLVGVSEQVAARIRDAVRERGPITFAEFMEESLYGPGGFYEGTPVGERGHFVTSPHVHAIFSRFVGAAVEALWQGLGRPLPLRLVEPGAGDGTMGRELVDGFARAGIDARLRRGRA